MAYQRRYHGLAVLLVALAWLALAASAHRDHGHHNPLNDDYDDDDGYDTDTDDWPYGPGFPGSGSGSGFRGDASGAGLDMQRALDYRRIHGILASVAMLVLFPLGSVLVRVVPARFRAPWVHAVVQMLGWAVYVAAAGLGIYLVSEVRIPGGGLLGNPSTRYHPIIGLVLLALLVVQPVVGFIHHRVYKRVQRRQMWSYLHLIIGRLGITLGIINGGLGLYLSNAATRWIIAYAVVAAVVWTVWMAVAVWAELRRARLSRQATHAAVVKGADGHREDKGVRYG